MHHGAIRAFERNFFQSAEEILQPPRRNSSAAPKKFFSTPEEILQQPRRNSSAVMEETDPAAYFVTREVCERLQRFPRIRNRCMGGCFEKTGTRRPVPIVGYEDAQRNKILPGTISTRGPGGAGQEHPTSAIWFLNKGSIMERGTSSSEEGGHQQVERGHQ